MSEPFYIAVKASVHASDTSVFGLTPEEVIALSKRFPDTNKEVINGILIKVSPLKVINSLSELGYRVICSSGEAEIVWTLRREVLDDQRVPRPVELAAGMRHSILNELVTDGKLSRVSPENLDLVKLEKLNGSMVKAKVEKVKEERLGSKPEDFAQYYDYRGSRIQVRNPSSLENIDEDTKVIIRSNEPSSGNPLSDGVRQNIDDYMNTTMESHHAHHSQSPAVGSVHQTLDEMDFERGIWTSAMVGDIERVKLHLRKGISPDTEDKGGYTALHYAARCGHPHVCATLLEAGAIVNKPTRAGGATALHRAAMSGHIDICNLLIRYGADAVAKDVDGRTPLHRAVEGGHSKVISFFLELVPTTALEKDHHGKTPSDYAENIPTLKIIFEEKKKSK